MQCKQWRFKPVCSQWHVWLSPQIEQVNFLTSWTSVSPNKDKDLKPHCGKWMSVLLCCLRELFANNITHDKIKRYFCLFDVPNNTSDPGALTVGLESEQQSYASYLKTEVAAVWLLPLTATASLERARFLSSRPWLRVRIMEWNLLLRRRYYRSGFLCMARLCVVKCAPKPICGGRGRDCILTVICAVSEEWGYFCRKCRRLCADED